MKKKTAIGGGIFLAIVAGAAAYWKWGMSQDQKDRVKDSINDTVDNLKEKVQELTACCSKKSRTDRA